MENNNAKRRNIIGAVAVILALAFVCGVCYFAITNHSNNTGAEAAGGAEEAPFTPQATETAQSEESKLTVSTLSSNSATSLSVSDVVKKNADAVVLVTSSIPTSSYYEGFGGFGGYGGSNPFSGGGNQYSTSAGTGFFITADGYLLTNQHVINGAESVTVTLTDNRVLDAEIVGYDEQTDVAVLKVEGSGFPFCTLGNSDTIEVGQTCIAIGNPLGTLTGTVTTGIISALERTIDIEGTTMSLMQHDAAINEGNSGGPLFDLNGNVIGINNAKTSALGVEGLSFAIPISNITGIIDDLIANGYVTGRPVIGVTVQAFDENYAKYYGVVPGLAVYEVQSGSGAEKAGIKAGDVLTEANGQALTTLDDLTTLKESCKVGDTIAFTVYRDESTFTANVVLSEDIPERIATGGAIEESSFAA